MSDGDSSPSPVVEKKGRGRKAENDGDDVKEVKKRGRPAAPQREASPKKVAEDGEAPAKRGRGRPKKGASTKAASTAGKPATRGRGRPKKKETKKSESDEDEDDEENGEEDDE